MKRAWHGLLLAALVVVAACDRMGGLSGYLADIQVNETTKKLFDKGLKMALDGGDQTVNFTATESWTIDITSGTKAVPSWVSVTPMSGEAGPSSIAISVEPNTDKKARSADITIKAGSVSSTVVAGRITNWRRRRRLFPLHRPVESDRDRRIQRDLVLDCDHHG